MGKEIIAVDFDDVVANFNSTYIEHHNNRYGTKLSYHTAYTFDMPKLYGIDREIVVERVRHFCLNHHDTIEPVDGAVESLLLLQHQYDLHMVTNRCESLRPLTREWLRRRSLEYFAEMHFTNGFGSIFKNQRKKLEVCREIGARVLIDDGPSNALEVGSGGVPVLLFNHPWNTEVEHPNVTRVSSWDEVRTWVEKNV